MVDPFRLVDTEINGIKLSVPIIVQALFEFIHLEIVEGIFRINGSMKKVNYYYSNLSRFNKWLPEANVYDICSLLKKVLLNNFKFFKIEAINLPKLFGNEDDSQGSNGDQNDGDNDSSTTTTRVSPNENKITNFNWNYFNHLLNNQVKDINLNVLIYSLNFINSFLQYNELTKMSILNFAIIFQPMFFPCDNLILLPNFINLLKYLLENKSKILINKSLINDKLSYNNSYLDPELDNNSFLYRFKNFKNKSIDSINISKKVPLNDYFKYSKFGKSAESLPISSEQLQKDEFEQEQEERDDIDVEDQAKSEQDSKLVSRLPMSDGTQHFFGSNNSTVKFDSETIPETDTTSIPKKTSSSSMNNYVLRQSSLVNSKSFHCREELYQDESFQSLDPLDIESQGDNDRFGTTQFKRDSNPGEPLKVDPEVNELVKLKDVNTKSFEFDIDLDESSNSSFHSIDNSDSDNEFAHQRASEVESRRSSSQLEYNAALYSNGSQLTNDTSFRPDQLDADIDFGALDASSNNSYTAGRSPSKKKHSSSATDFLSSINTFAQPNPNLAKSQSGSPTKPKNQKFTGRRTDIANKRSSRILTKIESKLSLDPSQSFLSTSSPTRSSSKDESSSSTPPPQAQPRSQSAPTNLSKRGSIIDNSRNFINMFKNENTKRNFSLKIKSKGVY